MQNQIDFSSVPTTLASGYDLYKIISSQQPVIFMHKDGTGNFLRKRGYIIGRTIDDQGEEILHIDTLHGLTSTNKANILGIAGVGEVGVKDIAADYIRARRYSLVPGPGYTTEYTGLTQTERVHKIFPQVSAIIIHNKLNIVSALCQQASGHQLRLHEIFASITTKDDQHLESKNRQLVLEIIAGLDTKEFTVTQILDALKDEKQKATVSELLPRLVANYHDYDFQWQAADSIDESARLKRVEEMEVFIGLSSQIKTTQLPPDQLAKLTDPAGVTISIHSSELVSGHPFIKVITPAGTDIGHYVDALDLGDSFVLVFKRHGHYLACPKANFEKAKVQACTETGRLLLDIYPGHQVEVFPLQNGSRPSWLNEGVERGELNYKAAIINLAAAIPEV